MANLIFLGAAAAVVAALNQVNKAVNEIGNAAASLGLDGDLGRRHEIDEANAALREITNQIRGLT